MKPHIYFNFGWWRVSHMPKPYHKYQKLWNEAHRFVLHLNSSQERKLVPDFKHIKVKKIV